MKKVGIYLTILSLSLTIISTSVHATEGPKKARIEMTSEEKQARLEQIKLRVNEIKAMDKSTLSSSERKALRKELREMKKEARAVSGGVYLSVGAIIIIILVLILIL